MARTRLPKGCDNCPPSSAAPRTKTIARSEQEPRKLTCAHLGRNTLTIAFPRYNHVCAAHVRARLRTQFRRCLARDRRAAGRPNRRQGSDFILFHSSKPALLSTAGERKIFAPFWDLNLDTPAWAGGQTRRSRETNFTQGRGGARTGEAKYGSGKPLRLGLFA